MYLRKDICAAFVRMLPFLSYGTFICIPEWNISNWDFAFKYVICDWNKNAPFDHEIPFEILSKSIGIFHKKNLLTFFSFIDDMNISVAIKKVLRTFRIIITFIFDPISIGSVCGAYFDKIYRFYFGTKQGRNLWPNLWLIRCISFNLSINWIFHQAFYGQPWK